MIKDYEYANDSISRSRVRSQEIYKNTHNLFMCVCDFLEASHYFVRIQVSRVVSCIRPVVLPQHVKCARRNTTLPTNSQTKLKTLYL